MSMPHEGMERLKAKYLENPEKVKADFAAMGLEIELMEFPK